MKLSVFLIGAMAISATGVNSVCITDEKGTDAELVPTFLREIETWVATGEKTSVFEDIVTVLAMPNEYRRTDWNVMPAKRRLNTCIVCNSFVHVIIKYRRQGMKEDTLKSLLTNLCVLLNLQTEDVCKGLIQLNAHTIFYIVDNRPNIKADSVCAVILQKNSCSTNDERFEWSVPLDNGTVSPIVSVETNETLKIVQISDLHYDPAYEVNGNADCSEPTCCRRGQNITNTGGSRLAGYWGDYNNCDTPWHALVDAFNQIKNNEQDATYIYFTGDVIDHGIWQTSQAGNSESIAASYAEMHDKFGSVPIFPILGNHEPSPLNLFAPAEITQEDLSTSWLFNMLANIWIGYGWLPESTRSTIALGGFYTVSPVRGFRIIALNNNVCYTYNWWLLYDPQDPYGQLKWLADTLLQAEKDGEFVHILAHIPPGDDSCQHTWAREYRRIINRFARLITGQFNGHTHNDEFRVFYDLENKTKAINLAWNGGSVTSYTNLNPNYRVYTVNANTHAVEEAETWIYNLTQANQNPDQKPLWFKSYSFKETYGLRDITLSSVNNLIRSMATNPSLLSTYQNHYVKHADPLIAAGCDASCLAAQLCKIVTVAADDGTQCDYFSNLN